MPLGSHKKYCKIYRKSCICEPQSTDMRRGIKVSGFSLDLPNTDQETEKERAMGPLKTSLVLLFFGVTAVAAYSFKRKTEL